MVVQDKIDHCRMVHKMDYIDSLKESFSLHVPVWHLNFHGDKQIEETSEKQKSIDQKKQMQSAQMHNQR
jgi:hypothetical protein